jgi:hypothetical protein
MQSFYLNGFTPPYPQLMASGIDAAVFHLTPPPVFAGAALPDQGSSVPIDRRWAQDNLQHRHP